MVGNEGDMLLRRIEISGFKSFGARTKVDVSSRIVGIVGPNGAGKSNVVDAVRWVLGEQSIKALRLKKSEEIIFAGTPKKSRASMAEVTIRLDNSDNKIPIELTEIELTRRLYRSGESEYLLNGRKTRLGQIELLLARSGFGTGSYSVVGQGMIDQILLANPAERKAMFDEASGIKAYELDRAQHLKKIEKSRSNLSSVEAILRELAPQQQAMRAQAELLQRRSEIRAQLTESRQHYLAQQALAQRERLAQVDRDMKADTKKLEAIRSQEKAVRTAITELEKKQSDAIRQISTNSKSLKRTEQLRDDTVRQLAQLQAEHSSLLGQVPDRRKEESQLKRELTAKTTQLEKITARLIKINQAIANYQAKISEYDDKLKKVHAEQSKVRSQILRNSKNRYLQHALGLTQLLSDHLSKKHVVDEQQLNLAVHKLARFLRLAIDLQPEELPAKLTRLQNSANRLMAHRDEVNEQQTAEIIRLRALELDQATIEAEMADIKEDLRSLADPKVSAEQDKLTDKIKQLQSKLDDYDSQLEQLRGSFVQTQETTGTADLAALNTKLQGIIVERVQLEAQLKDREADKKSLIAEEQQWLEQAKQWGIALSALPKQPRPTTLAAINRLEGELEAIAEIDPALLEEVAALDERVDYLNRQVADLAQAIVDTEAIISKLEKKIVHQFETRFRKINKQFAHYFGILFGGGDAQLSLVQGDGSEYGIEILVTPPNKRPGLLSSLSGGEKALSSIALLAAILSVNPSPFVILDEVDAALDEANSVKFGKIIQEISRFSQVLVITHNHQTMQVAGELMGVTAGPDGSSTILSVQLAVAEALSH